MKLIDTSSWIEYLRELDSAAGQRVEELVLNAEAGWCDMTTVELWNGARGDREKRELAAFEDEIILFRVDAGVWEKARKLARCCRAAGLTIPASDVVTAACAAHYGLELEHCDRHLEKIAPWAAKL